MAIAKINNGGKVVTHLDIMTGDPNYLKKTIPSNIGISDADMLEDLAGGSSTSDDGTTPYIPTYDVSGDTALATEEPPFGDDDTSDDMAPTSPSYDDDVLSVDLTETQKEKDRIDREREETNRAVEKAVEQAKKDKKEKEEKSGITSAGGRFMNKGGLATRKKKKK